MTDSKVKNVQPGIRLRPLCLSDICNMGALFGQAFDSDTLGNQVAEELRLYCEEGLHDLPLDQQLRQALKREYYVVERHVAGASEIIGMTGLYQFSWAWNAEAWLGWTAVEPALQSQGYGARMLALVADRACSKKIQIIHVETPKNGRAETFYRKNGFLATGTIVDHYGAGADACILSLRL